MTKKIFIILFGIISIAKAQEKNILFGIQIKPVIPNSYFNAGTINQSFYNNDSSSLYDFNLKPRIGQSLGMNIRKKISNAISYESGINFVQRRYKLSVENNIINDYTNFTIRSYEVPLQLLTHVRASEKIFMNGSFGFSYNVFISDIYSEGKNNNFFYQNTLRRKKGQTAFIAHLGTEYRTKTKGYFYLGFSLHRPFKSIVRVFPGYDDGQNKFNTNGPTNSEFIELNGNFLTVDLRYFFSKPTQSQ